MILHERYGFILQEKKEEGFLAFSKVSCHGGEKIGKSLKCLCIHNDS